ncbi:MAG: 30S ribosomal protein S20 [Treponema sp.]|nr:30S ribosomal protein S20 [Treponema sp.]
MAKKQSSAEKRHRKSEERRLRNKSAKSAVRTSVKKFVTLAQKKDPDAETALKEMIKNLDTAAGKGIISKNAAARKKSRMHRFYNSMKAHGTAAQ